MTESQTNNSAGLGRRAFLRGGAAIGAASAFLGLMGNGALAAPAHRGKAHPEQAADDGMIRLVRNHEQGEGPAYCRPGYDLLAAGGTTTVVFDPEAMELVSTYPSLAGTIRNCAGGPTPAGTWLSCEEAFTGLDHPTPHDYVFEVPADGPADPAVQADGALRA